MKIETEFSTSDILNDCAISKLAQMFLEWNKKQMKLKKEDNEPSTKQSVVFLNAHKIE